MLRNKKLKHSACHEIIVPSVFETALVARGNIVVIMLQGSKRWPRGESALLPPMWPRSNPGIDAIRGLSLLLVLFSERFFSGYSGFPLSSKPTLPNSKSTRNQVGEEPLSRCATSKIVIYLFVYLYVNVQSSTVKLRLTDTSSLQTVYSLGKECPHIFSKFNPLNTDTSLIRRLSMAPLVSVLKGFDSSSSNF